MTDELFSAPNVRQIITMTDNCKMQAFHGALWVPCRPDNGMDAISPVVVRVGPHCPAASINVISRAVHLI